MSEYATNGAILTCTGGSAPGKLQATANTLLSVQGNAVATTADKIPIVHITSFGACRLKAFNPPCMPAPTVWKDFLASVRLPAGQPLLKTSTIQCACGGTIRFADSGQVKTNKVGTLPHSIQAQALREAARNASPFCEEYGRQPGTKEEDEEERQKIRAVDVYWMEKGSDERHYDIFPEEEVTLHIETLDYTPGEEIVLEYYPPAGRLFKEKKEKETVRGTVDHEGIARIGNYKTEYEKPVHTTMGDNVIPFCDPNRENETVGRLNVINELRFVLHPRRCDAYDGEFGFDWMRDEYLYATSRKAIDLATGEYTDVPVDPVCQPGHREKLKAEYETLCEVAGKPYYIPWLSMFANHEEKTGKAVELQLETEVIDPKWKKSEITFDCSEGVSVEPERLEIKKGEKPPRITVRCSSVHEGASIIIRTVADKTHDSLVVGMMKLAPNKEYPLNIRWVPLLRKGHLAEDREFIRSRKKAITEYLRAHSLQQAMIVPSITMENEMIIDEKEWEREGKIGFLNPLDPLPDEKGIQDRSIPFHEYRKRLETKEVFSGVVVILCNMSCKGGAAGAGSYNPTFRNTCVIYKEGVARKSDDKPNYSTIAHEIGHVLGLEHTFERNLIPFSEHEKHKDKLFENEQILVSLQEELNGRTVPAEEYWDYLGRKSRKEGDIVSAKKYEERASDIRKARKACEDNIKAFRQHIESYEILSLNSYMLFIEGTTDNIMDYTLSRAKAKHRKSVSFFYWQWRIMQKEIISFHS